MPSAFSRPSTGSSAIAARDVDARTDASKKEHRMAQLEWFHIPMWGAHSPHCTFTLVPSSGKIQANISTATGGDLCMLGDYDTADEAKAACQRVADRLEAAGPIKGANDAWDEDVGPERSQRASLGRRRAGRS